MRGMKQMKHIIWISLLCFFLMEANAQKTNVVLENSETLSFDKARGESFQVLRGNVRFRHGNVKMYCDSAYFYDGKNSFDAFGHVKVVQPDSFTVTSNKMFYDGNFQLLRARGNVVMDNSEFVLHTENFDYYKGKGYGYYFDGGKIVDPQYVLTSERGYYYPGPKKSTFKRNVKLENPNLTIVSDTLLFDSKHDVATLVGPSHLYYKDYTVYTDNGWANTKTNEGALFNYSVITSKDGKRITADTILFNKSEGWARAYRNVDLQDSARNMIIRGNKGAFCENPRSAFVTQKPYVIKYAPKEDSLFLHADTLRFLEVDSTERLIRAYYNVRFYRKDLQGKCDSLAYNTADSIMQMFVNPVIWSEENQLTGDQINIYMDGSSPKLIHIVKNAMIVSECEGATENFNQLSSKESKGYIIDNQIRKIDMIGNARSIYFPEDKNGDPMVNKAEGDFMSIYLKNKKLEKIVMKPEPRGVLYPLSKVEKEDLFLRGFSWQKDARPTSWEDIFRHTK